MLSERARERDRDKEKSSRTTIFNFHVRGMSDIFEPANGDRVHSDGRAELLDNAAGGIEIGEAGMLIPRNMRGPACPALLPRPLLPPSSRLPAYPPSPPRPAFTYPSHDRVASRVSSRTIFVSERAVAASRSIESGI